MYKSDLALNYLQWFICLKIWPTYSKTGLFLKKKDASLNFYKKLFFIISDQHYVIVVWNIMLKNDWKK